MMAAQLTRADAPVAFEWAAAEHGCRQRGIQLVVDAHDVAIRGRQRYEIRLVKDTSGSSPGYPWAVFCPALDLISAGSTPCDALEMIADAVNEALADGAIPGHSQDNSALDALYQELVQTGLPTAEVAIWLPDPDDGYTRRTFAPKPAHAGGIRKIGG